MGLIYYCTSDAYFGSIDLATGVTASGPQMTDQLFGLAVSPAGVVYGLNSNNNPDLYTIDPATAVLTLIGSTGISTMPANPDNALAFSPAGVLYCIDGISNLYTINTSTGTATLVGALGHASAGGITFGPGGLLYEINDATGDLSTLDTATGAATLIGATGFSNMYALVESGGILYGLTQTSQIATLNTTTGAGTLTGSYGLGVINDYIVQAATQYVAPAPPVPAGPAALDVRLYDATGHRMTLPHGWIENVTFEVGERGGCLTGSITVLATWQELPLAGTEYVDIRLWPGGNILYRGWVRQPQSEIGTPEKVTLNLFGLMTLLNGYQVRRDYVFGPAASIEVVFLAMARDILIRGGRFTNTIGLAAPKNVLFNTTGVAALGITVATFSSSGSNFSDAMNSLCDLAPGQLIWGCEVDTNGINVLYLRPVASAVGYRFGVGTDVQAYVYPPDANQVVNRLILTGGKLEYPNLMTNGSFEQVEVPGETTSNLLQNASFEDANPGSPSHPALWQVTGDPTLATSNGRTGSNALDMDNNPSAPEAVYQDVYGVIGVQSVSASCWANIPPTKLADLTIVLEAFNGAGTSLASITSGTFVLDSSVIVPYEWQHYQLDWTTPANTARVRVKYAQTAGSPIGSGMNLDDCSFWINGLAQATGWRVGAPSGGTVDSIQWDLGYADSPILPYEPGVLMAKVGATITGGAGSYVEICSTADSRPSVSAYATYNFAWKVFLASGSGDVQIGCRFFNGQSLDSSIHFSGQPVGYGIVPVQTITAGNWFTVQGQLTTGPNTTNFEPFIWLEGSGTWYLDGVLMIQGPLTTDIVTSPSYDDTWRATRATDYYTSMQIGTDAAASITNWGEREALVSNDNVVDLATTDAFAEGFFRAYAVPAVQATLTLEQATGPIALDGLVRLLNLPSPPPALAVSKVKYTVAGPSVRIDLDLGLEQPDLAVLLRRSQSIGIGGVPWP